MKALRNLQSPQAIETDAFFFFHLIVLVMMPPLSGQTLTCSYEVGLPNAGRTTVG